MVETRIVEDPEFRNEVEITLALRQGLRELQKRGEIAPLLSPRRAFWSLTRVALAASVAAVALGAASFLFFSRQDLAPPGGVTETLHFVQTRSPDFAADATWQRPQAPGRLELRFDVGLEPAPAYGVVIERLAVEGRVTVLESPATTVAGGEAVLELDGARLAPGAYELRLAPLPAGTAGTQFRYTLQVLGP